MASHKTADGRRLCSENDGRAGRRVRSCTVCLLVTVMGSAWSLTGCGPQEATSAEAPEPSGGEITLAVENRSGGDISRVAINCGVSKISFGAIANGDRGPLKYGSNRVPRSATAHWRDDRKEVRYAKLELRELLGEKFSGTIVVVIDHRHRAKVRAQR